MKLMMKLPPPRSIEYSHLSDSLNGIITLRNGDLTPGVIPRIMVDGQTLQNSGLSDNGSNISSTLPLAFGANAAGLGPAASPWIGRAAGGSNLYLNTPSGSSFAWMFGNVVAGLNTSAGTMFGANASPGARIESRTTTGDQLRLSYDASNYEKTNVSSAGNLSYTSNGTTRNWYNTAASPSVVMSLVATTTSTILSIYDRAGDSDAFAALRLYNGSTHAATVGYVNMGGSPFYLDNYVGSIFYRAPAGNSHLIQVNNVTALRVWDTGTFFGSSGSTPGAQVVITDASKAQFRAALDASYYLDLTMQVGGYAYWKASGSKYRFQNGAATKYVEIDQSTGVNVIRADGDLYLYPVAALVLRGLSTTSGTQIVSASGVVSFKVNDSGAGFFGSVAPQQAHLADPTDLAELIAWASSLNSQREAYGLCAAS